MSNDDVEVVRRMVERWNAGDVEGWVQCWHADAEWISDRLGMLDGEARTYRGHGGLRRFPVEVLEGFADLGQIEAPRLRDAGDRVVVLADYRARAASGPEVAMPMGWVFEVRGAKIARGRDFIDQREALAAAGLAQ